MMSRKKSTDISKLIKFNKVGLERREKIQSPKIKQLTISHINCYQGNMTTDEYIGACPRF